MLYLREGPARIAARCLSMFVKYANIDAYRETGQVRISGTLKDESMKKARYWAANPIPFIWPTSAGIFSLKRKKPWVAWGQAASS